jgi:chromosome partitioning protein
MSPPRILAVTNQKGGVGKTTLSFHLAARAAEDGQRVLLVDFDAQGNATTALLGGMPPDLGSREGAAEIFLADRLNPVATASGVHLLPGHQHLDGIDSFPIEETPARRAFLCGLPYDFILFDTPPSVGLRNLAPLLWADQVLIPIEPNSFAAAGLANTLDTIRDVRISNPHLTFTILINRLIPNSTQHRAQIAVLSEIAPVFHPFLANRVAIGGALDECLPVWRFKRADSRLKKLWRDLCGELLYGRN